MTRMNYLRIIPSVILSWTMFKNSFKSISDSRSYCIECRTALLSTTLEILRRYEWDEPTPTDQKMNAYIKEIAMVYSIGKALAQGIRIEVVSRMLGHTNIKTTRIYAKVADEMLAKGFDEMANIYAGKYSLAR